MKAYHPKCSIILVKALRRQTLGGGKPADRARFTDLQHIDLTPMLMTEGAALTVSKSVRQPSGEFSLSLPDQPAPALKAYGKPQEGLKFRETLWGLAEPMDWLEIRLAHNSADYPDGKYAIIMRGLITQVSRGESMSGGRPQRTVEITGHDFGKLLQIIQIYYLYNTVMGSYYVTEFKFFERFASENDAKIRLASDVLQSVTENVINPVMTKLLQLATPPDKVTVVNKMRPKCTIQGAVSPWTVSSFQDVSLYDMLRQLFDVGPFNELYVDDLEDGIDLVLRPLPYFSVDGTLIQGAKPARIEIADSDIESIALSRSDESVANFYWVDSNVASQFMMEQRQVAMTGGQGVTISDWAMPEYVNTDAKYYGFRKMEVNSMMAPPSLAAGDTVQADQIPGVTLNLGNWLADRRKLLGKLNKDALVFESGRIALRGNERVRHGMTLVVRRGQPVKGQDGSAGLPAVSGEYYVHGVQHEFQPFNGTFRTTAHVERGTGWVNRASPGDPKYTAEISTSGI